MNNINRLIDDPLPLEKTASIVLPLIRFSPLDARDKSVSVILLRHGESTWNAKNIWQGQSNPELTEKGINQARKLAESLKSEKIDLAFSSDLIRAVQTALIICDELKLGTPIKEKKLRERAFSSLEGKSISEISRILGKKVDSTFLLDHDVSPYSETIEDFDARVFSFFREVSERYQGKSVLVVAHGGILRTIIRNYAPEKLTAHELDNASVIRFTAS